MRVLWLLLHRSLGRRLPVNFDLKWGDRLNASPGDEIIYEKPMLSFRGMKKQIMYSDHEKKSAHF
jgi:hypothetical protein